ncbi:MAG: T9SS type A sorting domain-containing protein [Saprospiraceae bacterium]|nr:T9SS type A sorting domain-containing protein [Saprospiraceae bacterium]
MISNKYLLFAFSILCIPISNHGQESLCSYDLSDTSKCYILKKYIKPPIRIEKKWESKELGSTRQVPLLADIDGDCIPEILMRGIKSLDIFKPDTAVTHFYSGRDGSLNAKFYCEAFQSDLTPVIADVDNDGINDIIISSIVDGKFPYKNSLLCYDYTGKLKWISDKYIYNTDYDIDWIPQLAVADFNQDGKTEIYCNNRIFNGQTGKLLLHGGSNGEGEHDEGYITNSVSVAAQLDDNPNDLELAAGYSIYKIIITNPNGMAGNQMIPINIKIDGSFFDGKTAVADINRDGKLDVIVTYGNRDTKSKIYSYTLNNDVPILLAQNFIPGIDNPNSCPTISDIDGNGIPNILVSKHKSIHNFEYDGTFIFKLKWSLVVQDTGASTGITTFDLNGDGIQEIIYRDHFNLLIIDGSVNPPQIIDSIRCIAGTYGEYPIIADIGKKGNAQICTVCGGIGPWPQNITQGYLTAFGSPDSLPGWAPARSVWNQYAYNPLFINDDLTVPTIVKNHATYKNGKYNNFLQQESLLDSNGMYKVAAASVWGKINCIHYDPVLEEYTVEFDVFNNKNASSGVNSNLPIAFYNGDPSLSGSLLGIYYTKIPLNPGDSLVGEQFTFKASSIHDLHMVVNTSRNTNGMLDPKDFSAVECDYTDNYFHTTDIPKTELISASVCNGNAYRFFDTLLTLQGRYVHTSYNANGCDSIISILDLNVRDTVFTMQNLNVCDSLNWNGLVYRENGIFINHFQSANGCDSMVILNLSIRHSSDTVIQTTACRTFGFNDKVYTEGGKYFIKLRNRQACDSLIELDLDIIAMDTNITKLANSLIALDSVATYQWVDCNDQFAVIPGATDKIFIPNKDGSYAVIITTPPCTDTSYCLPIIISKTIENKNQRVHVHPNPVSDKLFIQFQFAVPTEQVMEIRDLHGRLVMKNILPAENHNILDVDVSHLISGLYMLSIHSSPGSQQLIFLKI